jgi:predicted metalloprotease with PDZ domain
MTGNLIKSVDPDSPAYRAGILPGEILVSINGNSIHDVLDYRYFPLRTGCCSRFLIKMAKCEK